MNLFQGLCLLVALAIVGFVAFRAYLSWRAANPKPLNATPTVGIPMPTGDMQFYDITPAKPCDSTTHCKFVPSVVSITEPCQLAEAEKAVKTLSSFATKAKKIAKTVRGDLQAAFDFNTPDAPEVAP